MSLTARWGMGNSGDYCFGDSTFTPVVNPADRSSVANFCLLKRNAGQWI